MKGDFIMSKMKNFKEAVYNLGLDFSDKEHVYFSQGKDWLSAAYLPKYPNSTAGDLSIRMNTFTGSGVLMAPNMGLGGQTRHFSNWNELISMFNNKR